jgi:RNA polymerase sigma-70 factor (ECF subfamily)
MGFSAHTVALSKWPVSQERNTVKSRRGSGPETTAVREASDHGGVQHLRDLDDAALVRAFQAGQREAFDVIVERHRRTVYLLCHRFVPNQEDAADLAQDVFVRAFKGLGRFKGDAALSTWLHRIAVNAGLNRVAVKRPIEAPLEAAIDIDTRAADPLDEVLRGERAERVRRAVAELPPKQRATLVLRVYHEYSHEEIAATLGGSVGGAKANLFHALGSLRRRLKVKGSK